MSVPPAKRPRKVSPPTSWELAIGNLPAQVPWATTVCELEPGLADAIKSLNESARPLRFGTPCAGFEAPVFALRELGLHNVQHAFSIDLAPHAATFGKNLRQALVSQGGSTGTAFLGPAHGDLLKLCAADLP